MLAFWSFPALRIKLGKQCKVFHSGSLCFHTCHSLPSSCLHGCQQGLLQNPLSICNTLFLPHCHSYYLYSAFASFGDQFLQGLSVLTLYWAGLLHNKGHRSIFFPFYLWDHMMGFLGSWALPFKGCVALTKAIEIHPCSSGGPRSAPKWVRLHFGLQEGWAVESKYTKEEKI